MQLNEPDTKRYSDGQVGQPECNGAAPLRSLDSIAKMTAEDRALAEPVHVTVTGTAPELSAKTWYGMPPYANADGKVVSFKNAGKFGQRYSTLECQDSANLDDGDLWPVSYALKKWIPAVDKKVSELVEAAIS